MYTMGDTKTDAILTAQRALARLMFYPAFWINFGSILNAAGQFKTALLAALDAGATLNEIMPVKVQQFYKTFNALASDPIIATAMLDPFTGEGRSEKQSAIGQAYTDMQAVYNALLNSTITASGATGPETLLSPAAVCGLAQYWPIAAAGAALLLLIVIR